MNSFVTYHSAHAQITDRVLTAHLARTAREASRPADSTGGRRRLLAGLRFRRPTLTLTSSGGPRFA